MKGNLLSPLIFLSTLVAQPSAIAHGVKITYQVAPALEIQATYDGGAQMANAQVTVYAPNNPSEPWLSGTTDLTGRFTFIPNVSLSGNWEIQVRQAGHGAIVTMSLEEALAEALAEALVTEDPPAETRSVLDGDTNYTPPQLLLMGATGVWGFIGTALFFFRRRE